MLGQRRRRWPNIKPAWAKRLTGAVHVVLAILLSMSKHAFDL